MDAPFRIAIRAEGNFVNAYLADLHTMQGAQLVASISRGACDADRTIFEDFQRLAQRMVSNACVSALGVAPEAFETTPAPEAERAGRG